MEFPTVSSELRRSRLESFEGKLRVLLDTDTYNEVDDQFAVVHALLAPERITLEAICAAPFHNDRSDGPGDGMEKSYDEIIRLLERLEVKDRDRVLKGPIGIYHQELSRSGVTRLNGLWICRRRERLPSM